MATYVNDLRLKEIATGDESGTWGTSTNTNLELIADAFSYATKDCFASDADATETMADGVADEIRSLYLKVTSSATLTATRTLTLAPNTVSKTWIIENATTGGQSISISQGSGANVTIPNGDTKIIYTDGAGAGAAVTDAFASLNVGDLTATNITGTLATAAQPNITSVGTLTGLTTTGDINLGDNDKAIFGASSDLQIYHDGSDSYVNESGTGNLYLQGTNHVYLTNSDGSKTYFTGNSPSGWVKLYHDNIVKLETTSTGIDVTGTVTADGLTVDTGTTNGAEVSIISTNTANSGANNPTLKLYRSGVLSGGFGQGGLLEFAGQNASGTEKTYATISGDIFDTTASSEDGYLTFKTMQAGTLTAAMEIDQQGFVGIGTTSPAEVLHVADTGTAGAVGLRAENSEGHVNFTTNGGGFQFETGASGTVAVIDSSGNVGIGTSSPAEPLHVQDGSSGITQKAGTVALIEGSGNTKVSIASGITSTGELLFGRSNDNDAGRIIYDHSDDGLQIWTNSSRAVDIDSSGNVLVGGTTTTSIPALDKGIYLLSSTNGDVIGYSLYANEGSNNRRASFFLDDTNGVYGFDTTASSGVCDFVVKSTTTERMRIKSYGTVCVNCTAPAISTSTAFAVQGSGTNESVAIECRKSTTTTSSAQRFIRFFANGGSTSMGGIVGNGASNVQFASISDERLKENIQPLSGSLNKVLALNPISYNWKDSGEYVEAGFVAQEVEQVLPEYVTTDEDADQTKGLTGGMTAGYISVLTKAIQEQQTIIESLEARITALES